MAIRIFQLGIRGLPGNGGSTAEGVSARKETGSISIFGTVIEKRKTQRPGRGTGFLGITRRLAECHPSVKTPRGR